MSNWKNIATAAIKTPVAAPAAVAALSSVQANELREAAVRFEQQVIERPWSGFLAGKAETCRDLAAKLDRYGCFVSEKQAEFAAKLVGWSFPKAPETAQVTRSVEPATPVQAPPVIAQPAPAPTRLPRICGVVSLDGFSRFTVGEIQLSLKNDGSLIWVKYAGAIAGSIDTFSGVYRESRKYLSPDALARGKTALLAIESNPKEAAAQNGILTGRCSCCGRPLTDPTSINIGIGPVCLAKF